MTLKGEFCIESGEYSHVITRRFLTVRGYGVVTCCPRRGHALYKQYSIGDGAKTVNFSSLLRVRVEVVRLMSNPSEDSSPVLKQHVMGEVLWVVSVGSAFWVRRRTQVRGVSGRVLSASTTAVASM